MNAGAYGGEIKNVLCKAYSLYGGEISGGDPRFGYRRSPFTGVEDIVCFADFRLIPGAREEIAERMDGLMARRKEKQPYSMPSAGSVFKRPKTGYAAALIDECGLKGRRVGGAQVSEKHAGFIVNTGGASCADVLELIAIIQREVLEKKGVSLECEVRVTGEV